MQFLPATWAIYGHGDINRPRNAIFAAARYLAAHGAPASIGSALYAYNPSWRYVDAVRRSRSPLRADPNALPGYYYSPVIYRAARGWVLPPPGYGIQPRHPGHSPSGSGPFPPRPHSPRATSLLARHQARPRTGSL